MTPGEIRVETLSVLRATRRKMISSAWARKLKRQDQSERQRAANTLLNIGSAIDTLELAALESIADAMKDNETKIERGTAKLRGAIESLQSVKAVLDASEQLLALVARIAPLLV